jgi:hypothetical protein
MRRAKLALVALLVLGAPSIAGCEGVFGPSKMAHGEVYTSGDSRYDGFFEAVHKEHEAAKSWPDEKTEARKGLVTLTGVREGSGDRTIVNAVRERAKGAGGGARLEVVQAKVVLASGAKEDAPLFAAIEETAQREIDRARRLAAAAERLETLEKQGKELAKQADEDRKNAGVDKADEKKMEHHRELRRELGGAIDFASDLANDARKGIADGERFLDDLDAALQLKEHVARPDGRVFPPPGAVREDKPVPAKPETKPEPPKRETKHHEAKPHEVKPKPAAPTSPAKPPAAKPAAGKPPPPPEGEVFNP